MPTLLRAALGKTFFSPFAEPLFSSLLTTPSHQFFHDFTHRAYPLFLFLEKRCPISEFFVIHFCRVRAEDIPIRIIANYGVIPKFSREHVKLLYFIGESYIESELRKLKCFYEGVRI